MNEEDANLFVTDTIIEGFFSSSAQSENGNLGGDGEILSHGCSDK